MRTLPMLLWWFLCACGAPRSAPSAPIVTPPPLRVRIPPSPSPVPDPATKSEVAPVRRVTLLAGGDVELGRATGKMLLKDPQYDPFHAMTPLLTAADLCFANLEGPLSFQHGETMSPHNPLVFTGPPSGADALARARLHVVSLANNHIWDYGKRGALETLTHLERVGVAHAGLGLSKEAAYAPTILTHEGVRVAFLAATDIWNQGPLEAHEARDFVARAERGALVSAVRAAKPRADVVVVSYHGGDEYADAPLRPTQSLFEAVVDAGADAVLGHHPHVVQGIAWRNGRPMIFSLGNFVMQMHSQKPWTEFGMFARLHFVLTDGTSTAVRLEVCPFRIFGLTPRPFVGDPHRSKYEAYFFSHLRAINGAVGSTAATVLPVQEDGCAEIQAQPPG